MCLGCVLKVLLRGWYPTWNTNGPSPQGFERQCVHYQFCTIWQDRKFLWVTVTAHCFWKWTLEKSLVICIKSLPSCWISFFRKSAMSVLKARLWGGPSLWGNTTDVSMTLLWIIWKENQKRIHSLIAEWWWITNTVSVFIFRVERGSNLWRIQQSYLYNMKPSFCTLKIIRLSHSLSPNSPIITAEHIREPCWYAV